MSIENKEELQENASLDSGTHDYSLNSANNFHGYSNEDVPSDESIHGWLKFFLIFVGIRSINILWSFFVALSVGKNFFMTASDVAFFMVYLVVGIFTLLAFHKRDSDAVFLAKTFVVICFTLNLLGLTNVDADITSNRTIVNKISSIIWCCLWFVYLCLSTQVKRLIPLNYRKTKPRDWMFIGAIVILSIICSLIST